MSTLGQWQGDWHGNWHGATEAQPGAMACVIQAGGSLIGSADGVERQEPTVDEHGWFAWRGKKSRPKDPFWFLDPRSHVRPPVEVLEAAQQIAAEKISEPVQTAEAAQTAQTAAATAWAAQNAAEWQRMVEAYQEAAIRDQIQFNLIRLGIIEAEARKQLEAEAETEESAILQLLFELA